MQRLVEVASYGSPGGIDQRDSPGRNTVLDARNLDSSGEIWRVRPGRKYLSGLDFDSLSAYPLDSGAPIVLALEFVPDERFQQDAGYSVILVGKHPSSDSFRFLSLDIARKSVSWLTYWLGEGAESDYISANFNYVKGLYRYKVNDTIRYNAGYLITNGLNRPGFIHASEELSDAESGSTSFRIIPADAKDGGDSDITYLEQVPKGKVVVVHKSRCFMLNTPDGANRAYFTGPDSNGVFTVNVWPSLYNFDIGDPTPITAAVSFRDTLVVFKEKEIWLVGGDGVGGNWALQKVHDGAGALSQQLVADVGDSIVFANRDGVYRWAGGTPARISDKIKDIWNKVKNGLLVDVNAGGQALPRMVYDKTKRRVIIHAGGAVDANQAGFLVYNLDKNTWDVWHMLPAEYRVFGNYTDNVIDEYIMALEHYSPDGTKILSFGSGHTYMYQDGFCHDETATAGGTQSEPIPFWLETQNVTDKDGSSKLFRNASIEMTDESYSTWLQVIPCVDGKHYKNAFLEKVSDWLVVDGEFPPVGGVYFYSVHKDIYDGYPFSSSDQILVYNWDNGVQYGTATVRSLPSSSSPASWIGIDMDLSSIITNFNDNLGRIILIPANATLNQKWVSKWPTYYFSTGGYGGKFGEALFNEPTMEKKIFPINEVGKMLRLRISGINSVHFLGGSSSAVVKIGGWSVLFAPRYIYRRNA